MYVMHNLTDFFFKLKLFILYEIDDCSLLGFKINVIASTYRCTYTLISTNENH